MAALSQALIDGSPRRPSRIYGGASPHGSWLDRWGLFPPGCPPTATVRGGGEGDDPGLRFFFFFWVGMGRPRRAPSMALFFGSNLPRRSGGGPSVRRRGPPRARTTRWVTASLPAFWAGGGEAWRVVACTPGWPCRLCRVAHGGWPAAVARRAVPRRGATTPVPLAPYRKCPLAWCAQRTSRGMRRPVSDAGRLVAASMACPRAGGPRRYGGSEAS